MRPKDRAYVVRRLSQMLEDERRSQRLAQRGIVEGVSCPPTAAEAFINGMMSGATFGALGNVPARAQLATRAS